MNKISEKIAMRIDWIDQLKGFAIFLVVYGHNFPITEIYIYSFHMPLFIFLAGLFHPKEMRVSTIISRAKRILVPYFIWSLILYIIWFLFGRNYGESSELNLSVLRNLTGVFYAQGGREYMDWGIPMWFLPSIFLTFVFFGVVQKIAGFLKYLTLFFFIGLGFWIPYFFHHNMVWSFDVALVSLFFYSMGFYCRNRIKKFNYVIFIIIGILHLLLFTFNDKIDMYRSQYGNILLFMLNGVSGIFFYVGLFKILPKIKVISYLGRNTITILATQIRAMTFLKLIMIVFLGVSVFSFSEVEKFFLSILQIVIIFPVIYIVNKYFPLLNGYKKSR